MRLSIYIRLYIYITTSRTVTAEIKALKLGRNCLLPLPTPTNYITSSIRKVLPVLRTVGSPGPEGCRCARTNSPAQQSTSVALRSKYTRTNTGCSQILTAITFACAHHLLPQWKHLVSSPSYVMLKCSPTMRRPDSQRTWKTDTDARNILSR
jgi:hypothetical protein